MFGRCVMMAPRFYLSNSRLFLYFRFEQVSSLIDTQKRRVSCSNLLYKVKSKQGKTSKAPTYSNRDIPSDIAEELGFSEFEEESAKIVEVLRHILDRRITTKITPTHLDSIQVQTTEGFIPLKVLSQLSFPKPNLIRLDMRNSKNHIHKAIVALKEFYPFIGVQSHGNDTIEIAILKKDNALKQSMSKDAKKQSEKLKSSLRSKAGPILKSLRSKKTLSKDLIHTIENYTQSVTHHHMARVEEIIEMKMKEIESSQ